MTETITGGGGPDGRKPRGPKDDRKAIQETLRLMAQGAEVIARKVHSRTVSGLAEPTFCDE